MAEDATGTDESVNPDSSVEVSQEPAGESFTVKVDGLEEQVSLEELRDGYQRQSDYTRKTQELASERKRLEQAEAIVGERVAQGVAGEAQDRKLEQLGVGLTRDRLKQDAITGRLDTRGEQSLEQLAAKQEGTLAQLGIKSNIAGEDREARSQDILSQLEAREDAAGDIFHQRQMLDDHLVALVELALHRLLLIFAHL